MSRKLIVSFAQFTPQQREAIRTAAARHGFEALFFDREADALPHAGEAEILLTASLLLPRHAPALRWLCTPFAGVDHLTEPDAFASPDAVLTNSSGAYGVTIAEHIVMVTLELLRRQQEYTQIICRRDWVRNLPIRAILGSRVTLLGTGDIGQETALRLRAFGPACLVGVNRGGRNPQSLFDRVLTQAQLEAVLPDTDLLILSLPGTPETRGMLTRKRLALLPDGAVLVNVGRGSILDQDALEKELRAGRLYAALDVFETEPLPRDSALWDCPNLLLTPHVAGNTTLPYTVERIAALFLEDFEDYCVGRPLKRQVDRTKGY